ncbi:hypothetical protein MSG28_007801 [Choristoneura fumiferana]|uniref:Uncharacterized protein n=1 Tax=Choristoneura fumiferana TaxID=7141 RepID=A0ACC0JYQ8_CHOFU|nr:hypothetical protein MSG28_007801 [Choristoneura fumiferana]
MVGPCERSARIASTTLLANPAVKQQCLHCCVSVWRVRQPVKLLALEVSHHRPLEWQRICNPPGVAGFYGCVTNIFLVNLSTADLLVTGVCMPIQLSKAITLVWFYGETVCKIVNYMQGVAVAASVFTIAAMSVDRWLSISPEPRLRPPSRRQAVLLLLLLWCAALLIFIPLLMVATVQRETVPIIATGLGNVSTFMPSYLQVVGPCARSARIATTILLANPAVKQQCLHCCVSAWRPIYVPLLGTGLLSEQEGLGHSSHAGPVRIGNLARTIESLRMFVPFLTMFSFTAKLVIETRDVHFCTEEWPGLDTRKQFGMFSFTIVYAIPGEFSIQ